MKIADRSKDNNGAEEDNINGDNSTSEGGTSNSGTTEPATIAAATPLPPTETMKPEPEDDPFDPRRLRTSGGFGGAPTKRRRDVVPVRRPDKRWWVRVHPSVAIDVTTYEDESSRRYIILENVVDAFPEAVVRLERLYLSVNRQNIAFFWPVKLPNSDGEIDSANESAAYIAERAKHEWLRLEFSRGAGGYLSTALEVEVPPPEWPEETLRDLLRIAFRGRLVETDDHPLLRRLRGEV